MTPAEPRSMLEHDADDMQRLTELTRLIGLDLQESLDSVIDGLNRAIENAITDLTDERTVSALHASVANNVEVAVNMMVTKTPASNPPPIPAAIRYAEQLAQRNVSGSSLRRAYHVGTDHLLARMFDIVQSLDCQPGEQLQLFHFLAGWIYRYVDVVTRAVMAAYETQVRHSHEREARTTGWYISHVLSERSIDEHEFETATGYRLNQAHIGCLMWVEDLNSVSDQTDRLRQFARDLCQILQADTGPLFTAVDRTSARVWFGLGRDHTPVNVDAVFSAALLAHDVRVAFGSPSYGHAGFRQTLRQAEHVAIIAQVSSKSRSRVVSYADSSMPVIARLAENIAATRGWIREVLGSLADDTDYARRQRETVRVFLDTAHSLARSAERLTMHRNSVKYRLHKAEEDLGRPLTEKQLDTQLALELCHTLGTTVLVSPANMAGSY